MDSHPLVLSSQRWRKAPHVPGRERRHRCAHQDATVLEAHQAGSGQLGQVEWLAEGVPSSGGGH